MHLQEKPKKLRLKLASILLAIVLLTLWCTLYVETLPISTLSLHRKLSAQQLSPSHTFLSKANNDPARPLIMYAYHETENARQNAEFFIKHALHDGADFLFMLNGETNLRYLLPRADHIKYRQRNNTCYDLGAHAEILLEDDQALANQYNKFILLNASIRGPFVPTWSRSCWSGAYLDRLSEKVKLVGMTYNCAPVKDLPPHIQSMILATDRIGLDIILKKSKMAHCFENMEDAVEAETSITPAIKAAGYKVDALMTAYSSEVDYDEVCKEEDFLKEGGYYGTDMHPYEAMFQKANRQIGEKQLELLTEWHNKMGYSSQPACGKR